MNERKRLQFRHRLEEVGERFGLRLQADPDGMWLPLDALSHVRVDGRHLEPVRTAARAEAAGLRHDGAAVRLPWSWPVEPVEDALLAFLGELLEADPRAFLEMPDRTIQVPADGALPESTAWLERFYGGDFLPREKKPLVADLRHSQGAWLRSVDADPLQIVDAASQIASAAAGFRPDEVQAALDAWAFDPFVVAAHAPNSEVAEPVIEDFASALLEVAPPGLDHVCFVNSGAEANEKALHLARINGPGGRRIFAFEGAFHGRTLLALFSTWNKAKRSAYQLPGFETVFYPLPIADDPDADPPVPNDWRELWAQRDVDRSQFTGHDDLLDAEVATLSAMEAGFRAGDLLATIIEPYQCEGGDRAPTRRFFHGLRALTHAWGVPLIFDEVQSGFGLSGKMFWYQLYHLVDADGRPDGPDLVTGAKRAQVGYVLSRWPDPEPSSTHAASVVRGRIHLDSVQQRPGHTYLAKRLLDRLAQKWPDLVDRPRLHGDAFAFDLPSGAVANHLISQRFFRGYMVYIAGERTLRYRLNRGMRDKDVERIFEVIDRSLESLVEQCGGLGPGLVERAEKLPPPAWEAVPKTAPRPLPDLAAILADETPVTADAVLRVAGEVHPADRARAAAFLGINEAQRGPTQRPALAAADPTAFEAAVEVPLWRYAADLLGTRVFVGDVDDFDRLADEIDELESSTYGPARRDSLGYLRTLVQVNGGIFLYAVDPEGLVGMAFAAPLELWPSVDGPRQDPRRGQDDTLYSADLTVASWARSRGLGYRLRLAMIEQALRMRWSDGEPRYAFITGRNRYGEAEAMWALNRKFGAYEVGLYAGQYGERHSMSRYYRIPLRRHDRRIFCAPEPAPARLDMGSGVHLPTGPADPLLVRARDLGVFDEAALTKLTVSNFITPAYARYAEYLRHLAPRGCRHLYFTSSPDEMVDKTLRAMKHQRADGRIAVGLAGGYLGHTTAAARSLTEPGGTHPRHGYFGWPLVPHPDDGIDQCLDMLDAIVAGEGADAVLGLFVEAVQARTGRVLDDASWGALCAWRDRTGVPLVLAETTSGFKRNGEGFWWVDGRAGDADVVLWWAGGQIGHVFSNDRTFVSKPLTLISTWDGDELSATRLLWQLYATEDAPVAERAAQLDEALRDCGYAEELGGLGLYRVLTLGERAAEKLRANLADEGVDVASPAPGVLLIAPPLTISADQIDRFSQALRRAARIN